jgi:ketosteroid isomerase-like protein
MAPRTVLVGATGSTGNRGKARGAVTKRPLAFVTEIRDGKTISIRAYHDREETLEAAGLSE